jgi:RNA polymerase sigma-70 factor (ECF subfamily)
MALGGNPGSISVSPTVPTADLTAARAAAGDSDAFRTLYEAHVGRVHALCLRLTGDAAMAEELTQDVFVRAWERLGSFRGESAFGTWLHRLAVNVALMALRAGRRRERRLPLWADPPEIAAPPVRDSGHAVDLERAIAALPPGCRAVFVLHDVEGWHHGEIAAQLDLAVGTCKAHLFRARRLLRERLS